MQSSPAPKLPDTTSGILAAIEDNLAASRRLGAQRLSLAYAWAVAHEVPFDAPPRRHVRELGAAGLRIDEFAPAELAVSLHTSPLAAQRLMADAIDLVQRLPRAWAAGRLPGWTPSSPRPSAPFPPVGCCPWPRRRSPPPTAPAPTPQRRSNDGGTPSTWAAPPTTAPAPSSPAATRRMRSASSPSPTRSPAPCRPAPPPTTTLVRRPSRCCALAPSASSPNLHSRCRSSAGPTRTTTRTTPRSTGPRCPRRTTGPRCSRPRRWREQPRRCGPTPPSTCTSRRPCSPPEEPWARSTVLDRSPEPRRSAR